MARKKGNGMKRAWTKDRLKSLRRKYDMNQAEFAELLPAPVDTLQNWEQGRNVWPPIAEFRFDELEAKAPISKEAVSA